MKTATVITVAAFLTVTGFSQRISGSSAATVSAEVIKGKLNPARSKPGDEVTLKLKDDLKSNGDVVLRKGTAVTGVVRHVAQSLIDVEWMTPASRYGKSHDLMIAIQSVTQASSASSQDADVDPDAAPSPISSGAAGLVNAALPARAASPSNEALLNMPSVVVADARTAADVDTNLGAAGDQQQLFHTGHG